jgi:hypothetical protein
LADFVNLFWLYEDYTLPHAKECVLPGGSMELVINLREEVNFYKTQHPAFTYNEGSATAMSYGQSNQLVVVTKRSPTRSFF